MYLYRTVAIYLYVCINAVLFMYTHTHPVRATALYRREQPSVSSFSLSDTRSRRTNEKNMVGHERGSRERFRDANRCSCQAAGDKAMAARMDRIMSP